MTSITVLRVSGFTLGDMLIIGGLVFAMVARSGLSHYAATRGSMLAGFAVLLIVVGGSLSTANALAPSESLLVILRILLVVVALPWAASILITDRIMLRRAIGAYAAGGAAVGFGSIAQGLFHITIPGSYVTEAGRFPGLTQNVSDAGGITSVAVVLSYYMLVTASEFWRRLFWMAMIVGAGTGLVLSGSVAGLFAAGIGILVLLLRGAIKFWHALMIALAGFVVIAATSSIQSTVGALSPVERFQQVFGLSEKGRYATSESRLDTYQLALDSFIQSPLIGAGMDGYSGVVDGGFQAHNVLIASLYQGGIFVGLGMLIVLLRPFGPWIRRDRSLITSYVLACTLGGITFAMTAPSMFNRYLWIPVMFMLLLSRLSPSEHAASTVAKESGEVPSTPARKSGGPVPWVAR